MAKTPAPIAKQLARLPVATSLAHVQRVISRQCSHRRTFSSQPDMVHVARVRHAVFPPAFSMIVTPYGRESLKICSSHMHVTVFLAKRRK